MSKPGTKPGARYVLVLKLDLKTGQWYRKLGGTVHAWVVLTDKAVEKIVKNPPLIVDKS